MNSRQKNAWLLTAMMAPLAHAAGAGWLSMTLAAGALLPFSLLPGRFEGLSKPVLWLEWGSVVLAAALLMPASGAYWPARASEIAIPVTLLVLAGLTENVRRGSNVAGVLCWMTMGLFLFISYMGIQGVHLEWLKPEPIPWNQTLMLTMLVPRLALLWEMPRKKSEATYLWIGVIGLFLGILVQGNLSVQVAQAEEAPFYLMARSLRMGSLSRLEPVVSLALTFSWFCLSLYLVMAGKSFLRMAGEGSKPALWGTVGAMCGAIAFNMQDRLRIVQIAAVILWIVMPCLHFQKRSKKDEKSG